MLLPVHSTPRRASSVPFQIVLGVCATWCLLDSSASAVILFDTADPTANTTAPAGALAGSGWQYEGSWGAFLGTPIAPNYFITAKHVGGSVGSPLSLTQTDSGGNTVATQYPTIANITNSNNDFSLWRISGTFSSFAPLYDTTDEPSRSLIVIGRGTQRGDPVIVNNELKGWQWGPGDSVKRWGQNTVTSIYNSGPGVGELLKVAFDANPGTNEADLSSGDSGGGVFINRNDGKGWRLAGINYSVDGKFNTTNSGYGFNAAIFDEGGLYVGNSSHWSLFPDQSFNIPTGFYSSRVSSSVPWINSITTFWNVDASGNWSTAANWSGGVPNGVDAVANLTFNGPLSASRAITVDVPLALGTLEINNATSYILGGSNTLTMSASSGSALIDVFGGNHTISAPLQVNSNTTVNIVGPSLSLAGPLSIATGKTLAKVGDGTLNISGPQSHAPGATLLASAGITNINSDSGPTGANLTLNANSSVNLNSTQHVSALNVAVGAAVTLSRGSGVNNSLAGDKMLRTAGLSIDVASGSKLDLANNILVLDYSASGVSPLAAITTLIAQGKNGLAWNGPGIVSSAAAVDPLQLTTLGVVDNSNFLYDHVSGASFAYGGFGEAIPLQAVLVKYTYVGDADLSGSVNISDYFYWKNGFVNRLSGWQNGDFNQDGAVTFDDFLIWKGGFIKQATPLHDLPVGGSEALAPVPEPSTLALMAIAAAGAIGARRRTAR